ncbi:MAG: hypothetical protein EBZ47_09410 [Chlamydiae bacterium]|nr:hypothetical protein [Chlamydiota bacterium]
MKRQYVTIVEGHLEQTRGSWRSFLVEDDTTYFVRSTQRENEGKEAITHYRVKQKSKTATMLELELETGKKNQIRVHCSEAGHSVVGDEKYGSKCLKAPRVYLHAALLGFIHPITLKPMLFERKPSPEFFLGLKQRPIQNPLSQLGL